LKKVLLISKGVRKAQIVIHTRINEADEKDKRVFSKTVHLLKKSGNWEDKVGNTYTL